MNEIENIKKEIDLKSKVITSFEEAMNDVKNMHED